MSRQKKMKLIGASGLIALVIVSSISIVVGRSLSNSTISNAITEDVSSEKLENLRKLMNETLIHAYLIPSNDAHQSEYVGKSDARLGFITEFTGSAGFAIVALDEAALWVDSRYHLQAERQVDQAYWTIMKMGVPGVQSKAEWLLAVLGKSSKVGFDPLLLSSTEISGLNGSLIDNGHSMIPVEKNLIDAVWKDKPEPNITPLRPHVLEYSGRKILNKIEAVRNELKQQHAEAVFLTALDDIACKKSFYFFYFHESVLHSEFSGLFNLRASDILHTPVFYSYALISKDDVQLYLHKNRVTSEIDKHFESEGVKSLIQIKDYDEIVKGLTEYVRSLTISKALWFNFKPTIFC